MDRFDWKVNIQMNIFILKILGLWPKGDESYGFNLYTLYGIFVLLFFELAHIAVATMDVFLNLDDLKTVTGNIFVLLMEMLGILKSYSLIRNMGMLKQLMRTINSDLFQPKTRHQRSLILPNLRAWKTIVALFWFLTVGWIIFWMMCPIFDRTFKEYHLPFPFSYPFNTKTSPYYEMTYLHQFIAVDYLSMTNVNIDTLIAALNMYIGAQLDILCDDLRNLHKASDANNNLKKCIHHHSEILKFATFTNRFYNWVIFVEFFVGAVSIGISMFQLTIVVPLSNEFYSFIVYLVCIATQVFMYCWFGNEIEIKVKVDMS
ncbi:7tm 6 domain containing protein [Asbolus verrucosus]|uniref:7tm 6 domain containing protein n=1 Tax=Asbolus verrucosus TaxID=1661398 RepID=A0A482VCP3_ASBVE|nr:7tm 6 domain containing protein [Asbolus verrucosus]